MQSVLTIGEIINKTKQYLTKYEVSSPRLDAEILLCHILQKDRVYLYVHFDQPLAKKEVDEYRALIMRRAKGEPVAYIIGQKNFLNLEFTVDKNVLVPRPETELLAECAIKIFKDKKETLLDLGTGSGAIALSVLYNCLYMTGLALDVSVDALSIAKQNAAKFSLEDRVEFLHTDMRDFLDEEAQDKFALILSNPPYITKEEMQELAKEVRSEPSIALDGGEDGLDFYRCIIKNAEKLLLPTGLVLLEIGCSQAVQVSDLATKAGFTKQGIIKDYAGLDRIVWLAGDEFEDADKVLVSKK